MTEIYDATRLPKHGQAEIARLTARIALLERDLAAMRARVEATAADSDTFAEPYAEPPMPLGKGIMVRFNGDSTLRDTYDVEMRDGDLYVLVNGTQGDTAIIPQSNNTIRIRRIPRNPQYGTRTLGGE
jgi:hypothetical protein